MITGLALGIPWSVLTWISLLVTTPLLILVALSNLLLILFYAFTETGILSFVLRATQVSGDLLYGAIVIYLLIGGIWSGIYTVLETA
jgi:hypothetical protein